MKKTVKTKKTENGTEPTVVEALQTIVEALGATRGRLQIQIDRIGEILSAKVDVADPPPETLPGGFVLSGVARTQIGELWPRSLILRKGRETKRYILENGGK